MTEGNNQKQVIKIAVVGDVHDRWEEEDARALAHLGVDLVLFVGDFGNESVEVVKAIASVNIPKAAVFGNHDAWYTATEWGRKKCPYDRRQEDRVQEQIDLMREADVGYGKLDFPQLNLTVVGGRPFSWGGPEWKYNQFYQERFGVSSLSQSAERILAAAQSAAYENLIFLGHNGPVGLGSRPEDPCGKDWEPIGGDFGDPDLADAIAQTKQSKWVPLVTFGHMHHKLRHTKKHLRTAVYTSRDGTVYLNAASVPRIVQHGGEIWRNFSVVLLQDGVVSQASLVWVGEDYAIASEQILYRHPERSIMQPALS
ncbi:MAG TPA: TIGR04168 family protein [Cyanobacteria bacterium UBA11368]|nr:TIGR04168 family protein [Cyanobacteria bacterium UBA11368]